MKRDLGYKVFVFTAMQQESLLDLLRREGRRLAIGSTDDRKLSRRYESLVTSIRRQGDRQQGFSEKKIFVRDEVSEGFKLQVSSGEGATQ